MPRSEHEVAVPGPPPRDAWLRPRFLALRWAMVLATLLPASCVYALGRAEATTLERLAHEGRVTAAAITGKEHRSPGSTRRGDEDHWLEATYTVDGRSHVVRARIGAEQHAQTAVGSAVEVTYLPADPATARLGRVDATRARDEAVASSVTAVFLLFAFGGVLWLFEHFARGALALARDGRATVGALVRPPARGWRTREHPYYTFDAGDGVERHVRARSRATSDLRPNAIVLYDAQRPDRAALLANVSSFVVLEPWSR